MVLGITPNTKFVYSLKEKEKEVERLPFLLALVEK